MTIRDDLHNQIKQIRGSGGAEADSVATYVEDVLDEHDDVDIVISTMDEIIKWADTFKIIAAPDLLKLPEVSTHFSPEDGTPIVDINTVDVDGGDGEPYVRVYLNRDNEPIYNSPLPKTVEKKLDEAHE